MYLYEHENVPFKCEQQLREFVSPMRVPSLLPYVSEAVTFVKYEIMCMSVIGGNVWILYLWSDYTVFFLHTIDKTNGRNAQGNKIAIHMIYRPVPVSAQWQMKPVDNTLGNVLIGFFFCIHSVGVKHVRDIESFTQVYSSHGCIKTCRQTHYVLWPIPKLTLPLHECTNARLFY